MRYLQYNDLQYGLVSRAYREKQMKQIEPKIYSYKVKLENMFSGTDIKNEKVYIIQELLNLAFMIVYFINKDDSCYDIYLND